MAKDTYYFSHDYNARNDDKILELRVKYGAEGYGLFWMLVETMAENENGGAKVSLMGGLSLGYGVSKDILLDFISHCISIELFYEENGFLFSRRMKKHKDFRSKLSEKGKEGAVKRWGKYSPPIGEGNAKERKGKEIKENNIQDNKLWFLKFYHSSYDIYKTTFNGKSTSEVFFKEWKEFIDFIYQKKYEPLFECKFLSPHDYADIVVKSNFTRDKWDSVLKKILSTGIKPEHNLYFRIPEFMGYNNQKTEKPKLDKNNPNSFI